MDELTADQQQELRADLLQAKTNLEQLLMDSRQSSETVGLDQPIGRLSRMDALQQQAMAQANRSAQQRRLKMIESALLAIKQERYGACRSCDEPIGYPRLKVRPETPFCLACQGQTEGAR